MYSCIPDYNLDPPELPEVIKLDCGHEVLNDHENIVELSSINSICYNCHQDYLKTCTECGEYFPDSVMVHFDEDSDEPLCIKCCEDLCGCEQCEEFLNRETQEANEKLIN